jgi:S1-C subfamily serine protease
MRKKGILSLVFVLLGLLLTGCSIPIRAEIPYTSPSTYEQDRITMIATVEPSVIVVKTDTGHGSGIIFKSEPYGEGQTRYYALTNHHVVEDGGEMKIHFGNPDLDIAVYDYASYAAYDIAVVRFITNRTLRVHNIAPINDNTITEIVKGQDVYAIGTPEDIKRFNYVTQGIVSLTSYPYNSIEGLAIMHDAELNPGNSGGPLFNLKGEVIGINVAKVPTITTKDGILAAEGLNYSLSINKIAPIIRGFTDASFTVVVRRPRLGVTVQDVDVFLQENAASLLPPNPVGVVVIGLDPTRNAKDVIQIYDLIIKMDGVNVASISDIGARLEGAQFGDVHSITVMRKVGDTFQEFTFNITLS